MGVGVIVPVDPMVFLIIAFVVIVGGVCLASVGENNSEKINYGNLDRINKKNRKNNELNQKKEIKRKKTLYQKRKQYENDNTKNVCPLCGEVVDSSTEICPNCRTEL